jgi:zinc protease
MLNRAKIFSILVFILCALVAYSQPDSILKYIEKSKYKQLENGLRVVTIENPGMKDVFCRVEFSLPKELETKYYRYQEIVGLLLGNAVTSISKGQLYKDFQLYKIVIKTEANRILMSFPKENLDTAIYFLSEILLRSDFDQNDLNILKRRKIHEIQSYQKNRDSIILLTSRQLLLTNDNFYQKNRTEDFINNLSLGKIEEFYKKYYKPNLTTLLLYGNLKSNIADSLLNKRLGNWVNGNITTDDKIVISQIVAPKIFFVEDTSATYATICITNPFSANFTETDATKINIVDEVLHDSIRQHPEIKGHRSSFTADYITGWYSSIFQTDRNINETVDLMLSILKNIKTSLVKNDVLKDFEKYQADDIGKILAEPEFVTELAWSILNNNLPKNYYSSYKNEISMDELISLAAKILKPETPVIVISGNKKKLFKGLIMLASKADIEFIHLSDLKTYKTIPKGFNAQNVINNYIAVIGGQKQITKLTDLSIKIRGNYLIDSIKYPIEWKIYHKQKNNYYFRQSLMMKDSVRFFIRQQVYDGEKGSDSSKIDYNVLQGKELQELKIKSQLIPELAYEELGAKTEIFSIDTLNKIDVFKIKVTFPFDIEQFDYYSLDDSLKLKSERSEKTDKGIIIKETIEYSKYQSISPRIGLKIPYQKIVYNTGASIAMIINSIDAETKLRKEIFIIRKEIKK